MKKERLETNESLASLPLHIHDDQNGLDYTLHGDYYLPDLEVPDTLPLSRWGMMALEHLEKQHPGRYTRMLLDGSLYPYCHEIDRQAEERFDFLMDGYKRCWEITEELKARDQMQWVGLMNNARHEVEHVIMTELIYA